VLSDIGKRITAKYYENAAKRSYFFGCSEGGREALIEAQRFPRTSTASCPVRRQATGPT
jgi:hypothetical protein